MNLHHTVLTTIVALTLTAQANASYPLPMPVDPVVFQSDNFEVEPFVPSVAKLGFEGTMLYGVGMRVDFVEFGNTAELIGLRAGDVITHVNGVMVQNPEHFRAMLMSSIETLQGQVQLEVAGPNLNINSRLVVCNVRANIVRIDAGPTY
jgi:hypothetical protein